LELIKDVEVEGQVCKIISSVRAAGFANPSCFLSLGISVTNASYTASPFHMKYTMVVKSRKTPSQVILTFIYHLLYN
jgi:hypothetical protein